MGEMADFALEQQDGWATPRYKTTRRKPMTNGNEMLNVMAPITLENGKTLWHKVGVAFPNTDPNKKHKFVLSITSLPVNPPCPLKLFVFPQENNKNVDHTAPEMDF